MFRNKRDIHKVKKEKETDVNNSMLNSLKMSEMINKEH